MSSALASRPVDIVLAENRLFLKDRWVRLISWPEGLACSWSSMGHPCLDTVALLEIVPPGGCWVREPFTDRKLSAANVWRGEDDLWVPHDYRDAVVEQWALARFPHDHVHLDHGSGGPLYDRVEWDLWNYAHEWFGQYGWTREVVDQLKNAYLAAQEAGEPNPLHFAHKHVGELRRNRAG